MHAGEIETLTCHRCAYDLRAQPRDGVCPECATPVAQSEKMAAIPVRPRWRDSDPRWRRRMLAGAWVLVLVPLVAILEQSGLAATLPVPVPYDYVSNVQTLEDTFIPSVYAFLTFCIGGVLFSSKERYRRPHRLDWTRRWGVLTSYVAALLSLSYNIVVPALVLLGIAAMFMSMPSAEQPALTGLFSEVGTGLLYYGPTGSDNDAVSIALTVFSGCVILLVCVPIYHALRSSGPALLARMLVAPLVLLALWHIGRTAVYYLNPPPQLWDPPPPPLLYFEPGSVALVLNEPTSLSLSLAPDLLKWLVFFALALWLTLAQVRAWRKPPRGRTPHLLHIKDEAQ